jgi:hypothetical protein
VDIPDLAHAKRPCGECPWRRDTPAGKFETCRYDALRATTGGPGAEVGLNAPMFACHMSPDGREYACAGWLAVAGRDHLGVRLAVALGRLDRAVLDPGDGWPELFGSYEEMAVAQGRPV